MEVSKYTENIQPFAKDLKLNLQSVLSEEGAPGLSQVQICLIALCCSYAVQEKSLIEFILNEGKLADADVNAAKSAAVIMGMNNVYYRFLHLADEKEFSKLPAKLRMSVIGNPGVAKVDFELMSLAISAISGCGMCINAHVEALKKIGTSTEAIQSAVRIASVIQSNKVYQSI